MIYKYFIFFVVLFFVFPCVFAGEDVELDDDYINTTSYTGDTVVALDDGHFNISFSDGSNGYCLEYGEKEASVDDVFIVKDTGYAVSSISNEKVNDYLKTYFIDYYDYAMRDKVVTQHTIWYFTDGFNGWRVNQSLVDSIIESPSYYPDKGSVRWNSSHEMVFEFSVFLAHWEHHQNFWGYKIFFRSILDNGSDVVVNESCLECITDIEFNENIFFEGVYIYDIYNVSDSSKVVNGDYSKGLLNYHVTANKPLLLIVMLFLLVIIIVDRKNS